MTNKKGFTLIELLVVISVVGILSTFVISSLQDARLQSKKTKIKADVNQVQTALELYHLDNNEYPQVNASFYCASNPSLGIPGLEEYIDSDMNAPSGILINSFSDCIDYRPDGSGSYYFDIFSRYPLGDYQRQLVFPGMYDNFYPEYAYRVRPYSQ